MGYKVLSLYDGMSCGMIAMLENGYEVDEYVAYEIDKYAVQTSEHNFPQIKHMGDVFKGDFTQYEGFDWLIGGSPCTYWSIAQTKNRETTASGLGWELFSQYVRAWKEAKPKYFLYENNKSMSDQIRQSITGIFGFEPICINSALVSAQNRQRLYWVGIRNADGTYRKAYIEQPKDRGILLRDVLETGTSWLDKSRTIGAAESVGVMQVGAMPRPNGEVSTSQGFRVYSPDGKSVTIRGNAGGAGGKTGLYALESEPARVPDYGIDGKSRPLSSSYKNKGDGESSIKSEAFPDNPNKQVFDSVAEPIGSSDRPIYEVKDGMITIKDKQYPIKLADGKYIIRKLTVKECMRLQTVPEWYSWPVSNSQAYKMLGNGWTVDVIRHLMQSALEDIF